MTHGQEQAHIAGLRSAAFDEVGQIVQIRIYGSERKLAGGPPDN